MAKKVTVRTVEGYIFTVEGEHVQLGSLDFKEEKVFKIYDSGQLVAFYPIENILQVTLGPGTY